MLDKSIEQEAAARDAQGEWHIAQTAKHCMQCRAPFLPGTEYWSTLHVETRAADAKSGAENVAAAILVRHDHCDACWRGATDAIYWRTRRSEAKNDRNIVDITAMHQLFIQLMDDEREEVEALRYVIALMLARKKVLKPVRSPGGARGDLVFRHPRDEKARLVLPAPELSEESLERLKEQLSGILGLA